MKVLTYENIGDTVVPTREVCQMIRVLTGEIVSREIPLRVLDKGRKSTEYQRITTELVKCDENGTPLEDEQPKVSVEIRKLSETPLRLSQGKTKVSLSWRDIDTFTFDDERETKREERLKKTKGDDKVKKLGELIDRLGEDKVKELLAQLGL